jgi:mannose-6-phosphate isomerase-like protein (cupin superfamily)
MTQPTMITSRKLGEQMTFVRTAEETSGALLEMIVGYHSATSWNGVPYHMHPNQDEHFEILEGSLTVDIAGTRRVYNAGEVFDVPRGVEHAMRNLGALPAQVRWQVRPALQTQQFFETTFGLADQGKLYHPLQFAVVARAYADVFRLTRLPLIARLLVPVLALVGHALGYRAYDERFRAAPVATTETARQQ